MGYSRVVTEDQRLRVLQMLAQDPEGSHNADVLRSGLAAAGHERLSARRVRALLEWLSGEGLVATEDIGSLVVARITERGEDVALGGSRHPGVAKPRRSF